MVAPEAVAARRDTSVRRSIVTAVLWVVALAGKREWHWRVQKVRLASARDEEMKIR